MKILLISAPCFLIEDDAPEQTLGLAYIAAYVRAFGYDVIVREFVGYSPEDFEVAINDIEPADIYGISCFSTNVTNARRITAAIRSKKPNAYIVAGGVHATSVGAAALTQLLADCVVTGEGEQSFLEIIRAYERGETPRDCVFEGKPIDNLDDLPFPERPAIAENRFTRVLEGQKVVSLLATRGCRFSCLHCNSIIFGGCSRVVRFRGIHNIIDEIKYLMDLGYTSFRFNDDSFTDHPYIDTLITELGNLHIKYRIFSRLDRLNAERIDSLKQSGCVMVSVGIESVNPDNLKFLRKPPIQEEILQLTSAAKLTTRASFMVGLPFDCDETIKRDFTKAATLPFDEFAVYALIPYPGTPLWSEPAAYGYVILDSDYEGYVQLGINKRTAAVMSYHNAETGNSFTPEDVTRWVQTANDILSSSKRHMKDSGVSNIAVNPS